jgi:hypothetical protein
VPHIGDFYDEDPRRRASEEIVYGDGWTTEADPHATYRLNWVVDTGELYTVREPHPGGLLARYLDELRVDQPDLDELTVRVLAVIETRDEVETVLRGWGAAMTEDDSLAWLEERLAARSGS